MHGMGPTVGTNMPEDRVAVGVVPDDLDNEFRACLEMGTAGPDLDGQLGGLPPINKLDCAMGVKRTLGSAAGGIEFAVRGASRRTEPARAAAARCGVTDAGRRNPAVSAQAAATLHLLTRGRAVLGIGVGEREGNQPYGVEWTKPVARFEEAVATIRALWNSGGDLISREFPYFPLRDAAFDIPPYRGKWPEIWIAAHGPRMLRAAGRYADAWYPEAALRPQDYALDLQAGSTRCSPPPLCSDSPRSAVGRVHGRGGWDVRLDSRCWRQLLVLDRLVPSLKKAQHEAIAIDLPADDDGAHLTDYVASAIAQATSRARIRRPLTVVGQSMAGFVAPSVAAELEADRLVLLNAMTPRPGEKLGDWFANTDQSQAAREFAIDEGRAPRAGVDPMVDMFNDVPQHVIDQAFAAGEPPQSQTPFADVWPLDTWPDVPTRFLSAIADRLFPLALQQRIVADRLGIAVEPIAGGHLAALGRPEELTQALLTTKSV